MSWEGVLSSSDHGCAHSSTCGSGSCVSGSCAKCSFEEVSENFSDPCETREVRLQDGGGTQCSQSCWQNEHVSTECVGHVSGKASTQLSTNYSSRPGSPFRLSSGTEVAADIIEPENTEEWLKFRSDSMSSVTGLDLESDDIKAAEVDFEFLTEALRFKNLPLGQQDVGLLLCYKDVLDTCVTNAGVGSGASNALTLPVNSLFADASRMNLLVSEDGVGSAGKDETSVNDVDRCITRCLVAEDMDQDTVDQNLLEEFTLVRPTHLAPEDKEILIDSGRSSSISKDNEESLLQDEKDVKTALVTSQDIDSITDTIIEYEEHERSVASLQQQQNRVRVINSSDTRMDQESVDKDSTAISLSSRKTPEKTIDHSIGDLSALTLQMDPSTVCTIPADLLPVIDNPSHTVTVVSSDVSVTSYENFEDGLQQQELQNEMLLDKSVSFCPVVSHSGVSAETKQVAAEDESQYLSEEVHAVAENGSIQSKTLKPVAESNHREEQELEPEGLSNMSQHSETEPDIVVIESESLKSLKKNAKQNLSDLGTVAKLPPKNGGRLVYSVSQKQAGLKPADTVTTITISTNKAKNFTKIVIHTPQSEQVFKVNTSDLMKTTSGLKVQSLDSFGKHVGRTSPTEDQEVDTQMDITSSSEQGESAASNKYQKPEKILSETGDTTTDNPLPASNDVQNKPTLLASEQTSVNEGRVDSDPPENEILPDSDDQPTIDALAELGVPVESLTCIRTNSGQKLWVCPERGCKRTYPKQCMLKVHILGHYGVRPYKCEVEGCYWAFYTYFKLKRHKETHLKKKDFECEINGCGKRFTTVYNLNTHKKLHSRPANNVCLMETCGASFQTKRKLEIHMRMHENLEAPYKCPVETCGKHYYSANSLTSHLRSHSHKEEEVKCQWEGCGRVFDKPCRLRVHLRSHTGDRPYVCTFEGCGWSFHSAGKLKRHQKTHTNERKFECSYKGCGKTFLRSEHLQGHLLTHMDVKSFQCPVEGCGVKFTAKSSLYVHMKKHNGQDEKISYYCPIEQCLKKYTCKSSLRQHMLKFHTPILASDPSHMDYIALLAESRDLPNIESRDLVEVVSVGNALTSCNLRPGQQVLQNGGTGSTMLATSELLPQETNYQQLSNGVITQVLLTPPEAQGVPTNALVPGTILMSPVSGSTNDTAFINILPSSSICSTGTINLLNTSNAGKTDTASVLTVPSNSDNSLGGVCSSVLDNSLAVSVASDETVGADTDFVSTPASASSLIVTTSSVALGGADIPGFPIGALGSSNMLAAITSSVPLLVPAQLSTVQKMQSMGMCISSHSGSARTDFMCNEILRERAKKRQILQKQQKYNLTASVADLTSLRMPQDEHLQAGSPGSIHGVPSDVVLTSGVITGQDLHTGMHASQPHLMHDEPSNSHELYHEDYLSTPVSVASDVQFLQLSDPTSRGEFPESTINLRDLE